MTPKKEVTFAVRMLFNHIRRQLDSRLYQNNRVPPVQGRMIGYLSHHTDTDVFQRDLEREFQIRRSTASAILKSMEHNGLITREPVPWDARLKKLVLTPQGEAFHDCFRKEAERVEAILTRDVGQTELDAFFQTLARFEENLQNEEARMKNTAQDGRRTEGKE
jgi:DNA-binding MarR family transcriptional regulator